MKVPEHIVREASRLIGYVGETIADFALLDTPYTFTEKDADALRQAYDDLCTAASLMDMPHFLMELPPYEED